MKYPIKSIGLLLAASWAVSPLHAQQAFDPTTDVANSGDTAWILTSSALVLLMTLPGLALFYGGLVRSKNFLSVLIQCMAVVGICSVLWIVVGYTLAFGGVTNGFLGNGLNWMLGNLGNVREGTAVPESAFAMFQMTFAVITPALMIGAWVERARFGWVVAFCALWLARGLCAGGPLGLGRRLAQRPRRPRLCRRHRRAHHRGRLRAGRRHHARQADGLAQNPDAAAQPCPDRRRCRHALGRLVRLQRRLRPGRDRRRMPSAILNTHIAASMAALVWILIEKFKVGKPTAVGVATGAIAGLATITPAAGYVGPGASILIGAAAAIVCFLAVGLVKNGFKIDDSLDVFAVHGVGGMLGSLLLALFIGTGFGGTGYHGRHGLRQPVCRPADRRRRGCHLVRSSPPLILGLGISFILPMRVSEDDERDGLDIANHGERAWDLD